MSEDARSLNQDWDKVAGKPVPEKSQQLATFVYAWAASQQSTSPSTTNEEIAIALELVAKVLRG